MGEMSLQSKHYNQALMCYEKALIILLYSIDYAKFKHLKYNQYRAYDVEFKYFFIFLKTS